MNQQRLGFIIVVLLALAGLGSAFFFYQTNEKNLQQFQRRERQLKQQLASAEANAHALEQRELELIDAKKSVEEQLTVAQQDLEQIKQELDKTKNESAQMQLQLTDLHAKVAQFQSERDALSADVKKATQLRRGLEQTAAQLRRDKGALEQTIATLKEQTAKLEHDNMMLKDASAPATPPVTPPPSSVPAPPVSSSPPVREWTSAPPSSGATIASAMTTGAGAATARAVTLPPIIVQRSPSPLLPLKEPLGKVISVDRHHQFLLIDKGATNGVRVGDRLVVSHGRKPLGVVTVIRVRETIAACETTMLESIQVRIGDVVSVQVSNQ